MGASPGLGIRHDSVVFKRKRRSSALSEPPTPDPDVLLAETIARHFEGGTVEGDVARIGRGADRHGRSLGFAP